MRRDEIEHVAQIACAERCVDDPEGMREGRLDDAGRGPADLAVAPVEVGLAAGVVVRDDDADRND